MNRQQFEDSIVSFFDHDSSDHLEVLSAYSTSYYNLDAGLQNVKMGIPDVIYTAVEKSNAQLVFYYLFEELDKVTPPIHFDNEQTNYISDTNNVVDVIFAIGEAVNRVIGSRHQISPSILD